MRVIKSGVNKWDSDCGAYEIIICQEKSTTYPLLGMKKGFPFNCAGLKQLEEWLSLRMARIRKKIEIIWANDMP